MPPDMEKLLTPAEMARANSYLHRLSRKKSRAFQKRISTDVAQDHRVLLAAWSEWHLAGMVRLDLATPGHQPHRGRVTKLLVAAAFCSQGVGAALMCRGE